uniref:Uncharacterized protein n=1 Tax=Neolamprologus brichardi TaxID=32507 RepID=A0A3Q4HB47_NEOBR
MCWLINGNPFLMFFIVILFKANSISSSGMYACVNSICVSVCRVQEESPVADRLLSTEEQVTLITESLTVTSTDQEKLLLLNKNTELRRVNKELMKLNEDWDQVYRSATLRLQHRLEALELENSAIKQLNNRLAKEYYEQALMQELKKNQELQEYIRLLESRLHHPGRDFTPAKPVLLLSEASTSPEAEYQRKGQASSSPLGVLENSKQEGTTKWWLCAAQTFIIISVRRLQDTALTMARCRVFVLCQQTEIYEAEYQTEHNDHKHTLQENRRLRKKREEMRQQVALLQEQVLKIYEDDFRRERSDKQMLQRLLLQKTSENKNPVLIHRCNNEQQLLGGDKRPQNGEKRKQHHPLCPKHPNRDKESVSYTLLYV